MQLKVIAILSIATAITAYCPNGCSGHGSCGTNDKCTCYARIDGEPAWTFADCSGRTCPKSTAWIGTVEGANDAHPVVECSNKGICDRSTGECACFENYEGIACERTVCPNSCSDAGVCFTQLQLAAEAGRLYTTPWDAEKHVGCICDLGRRGPDCSLVECPSGADVLKGYGNEAGRDCSGRGLCDYTDGTCTCFHGYYGTRCEYQTILG
mmetsp:Transcript_11268/g.17136  ORF Transcript_11268/g.17136 Transcript_11268/m.17136 type:complete len:210 (+) Transcript_11268:80-709(+)|eukprot:CAMPEP_0185017734 /NCGR_PEP_ID=MMETSP1103-20130426/649_1 /TAXON_ID=36769 /ORGANISM="Paraphysomonas bandaiensis, Strain Caron Lab Isolate" /LENGTH=209 /DNA_ID=CAMNT_0027547297 /DNA_START=56 /DNA_END=685 /DNA_ORIENTATION=+